MRRPHEEWNCRRFIQVTSDPNIRNDRGTDLEGWKKVLAIGVGLALTSVLVAAILSLTERVVGRCNLHFASDWVSCFPGPYVYHRVLVALIPAGIIQQWLALLAIPAVFGASLILAGVMLRGGNER